MSSYKNLAWNQLKETDILVFAIGYESRSTFIYELSKETRNKKNTLVFLLQQSEHTQKWIVELSKKNIKVVNCKYSDSKIVCDSIVEFFKKYKKMNSVFSMHVDYSAMPRSWYCQIPRRLSSEVSNNNGLCMWYNAGDYPTTCEYPSIAINSITVFSGVSLPSVDIKRFHIMGLGYDAIRTETVKTIIEPDALVCCYAFNPNIINHKDTIHEINKRIINNSFLSASLPLDNFSGMVDKICGLIYDIVLQNGQVILVPDGPKPLILAMSLAPDIVNIPGITCLHIVSNEKYYPHIEIKPRADEIWGFQVI